MLLGIPSHRNLSTQKAAMLQSEQQQDWHGRILRRCFCLEGRTGDDHNLNNNGNHGTKTTVATVMMVANHHIQLVSSALRACDEGFEVIDMA